MATSYTAPRTEIRLWNFATLDPSSREHAPTANSCKTEYCAMRLLVAAATRIRKQVRGAVVSLLGTCDPVTLPKPLSQCMSADKRAQDSCCTLKFTNRYRV